MPASKALSSFLDSTLFDRVEGEVGCQQNELISLSFCDLLAVKEHAASWLPTD
jgi:hypothetical protein